MTLKKNMDSTINEYSYKMVQNLVSKEKGSLNFIDKSLGVLTNDGVYGYYVYCKSKAKGKSEREKYDSVIFETFVRNIVDEFNCYIGNEFGKKELFKKYDQYFCDLSKDIYKLLFFKDILERILIYARYHAKACGDKDEK